jgi:shikimate dehydrogenase
MNRTSGPRACVMGYRVAYSRSPLLHSYWLRSFGLDGSYDLVDMAPEAFPEFLRHLPEHGYVGGNVTKPHKDAAFRLVDERDEAAAAIGAVNTVWLERGRLIGGNTDALGFLASLDEAAPEWDRSSAIAVVLGAGGAARAVVYALVSRGREVAVVNRTPERARDLVRDFQAGDGAYGLADLSHLLPETSLLVNATPAGTAGQRSLELDLGRIRHPAVICDLTYVPLETELLRVGRRLGHRTVDGLGMLMHQAVPGFGHWFGRTPTVTGELRALLEADIRARERAL